MGAEPGFPWAFLIIPIVILITVIGLFLLARLYQGRSQVALARLRSDWRRFEAGYQQVVTVAHDYLEDAQEPFLSLARKLRGTLDALDRIASPLRRQRVALNQRANDLSANPWKAVMGAPYLWYQLHRDLRKLEREMDRAWNALEACGQVENELAEVGWKLAQEARQMRHLQRRVQELLENLRTRHLQGDALDAALRKEQQAAGDLRRLPAYFYDGDAESVLTQADREAIIAAHQALETVRPTLDTLHTQAQEWQRQAQAAADQVGLMNKALDDLSQTLDTLPKPIDVSEALKQRDQMQQVAHNLQATLARLEVDSAALVTQEAAHLTQTAQETSSQLKRARRELAQLESVLEEVSPGFKDLSLRLATLGSKTVRPVQLTRSLEELAGLNRQVNRLGGAGRKRSPEQLSQDLSALTGARSKQKEMAAHVSEVEQAHAALLEALEQPPLAGLNEWLAQARRLLAEVAAYSAENWSRADNVAGLPDEVDALAQAAQALGLDAPAASIAEDAVTAHLEQARALAEAAARLQRRLENGLARLTDLQQTEQAARDRLEAAARQAGQIEFIVRSNQLLSSVAAQDLDRLSAELQSVRADLEQRQRGPLERKARQAEQLTGKLEQAANDWLGQLNQDTQETLQDLSAMVHALDEIAPLEEAALDKARELLEAAPAHQVGGRASRIQYPLEEVVGRLRQASQYWEACSAALKALGDFQPLIDTYDEANYQRGEARQAVSETTSWLRRKRAWPPTTVSLDAERQELEKTEAQWNDLRQKPTRAIARVAQLSGLGARYQALIERVGQAVERIEREETEVNEIESQIDERAGAWEALYRQYQDNPIAAAEMADLLESISREHEAIKRKYIQGSLDYPAALQELKKLHKRLDYFKAALDEQSSLDVRGNITRLRESRRVRD